ncbi:PilZ domain-containing protein [Acetitomaculum ruminis DSM 5522]|uniref:PilZ domain-containing protein n=1 Tax=Acetitomaculum ruminis DSM 5522 TaxID=1120918 RepID=A0A1I0YVJ6_9FIRM|nr:PilZ domain-containing protein [Acetitomaculum ruminis]SFB17212.1 PilZ domain-containing protein [Acetitomaculum ruminis DSM 5522]
MVIQDLEVEQEVKIEIVWGDKVFSADSLVLGKIPGSVFLKPYHYNGKELKIGENSKDFSFNLYAIDSNTKHRVGWKNVNLVSNVIKGKSCYICSTKKYLLYSDDSERREEIRTKIDIKGYATEIDMPWRKEILIEDISATGIGISIDKNLEFKKSTLFIELNDKINDEKYNESFTVKVVRTVEKGNRVFYGCSFKETKVGLLYYIFAKRAQH